MSFTMEQINLGYVVIRYDAPIIYLDFKPGFELGFPEMRELVFYAEQLSEKNKYVVLADIREGVRVTSEGRKYSAEGKNSPFQMETAVLAKNTLLKLAANFFFDLQKPSFPYRAFTEEQEAVDWLLNLPLGEGINSF
jgi:hypothetical protein